MHSKVYIRKLNFLRAIFLTHHSVFYFGNLQMRNATYCRSCVFRNFLFKRNGTFANSARHACVNHTWRLIGVAVARRRDGETPIAALLASFSALVKRGETCCPAARETALTRPDKDIRSSSRRNVVVYSRTCDIQPDEALTFSTGYARGMRECTHAVHRRILVSGSITQNVPKPILSRLLLDR